MKKDHSLTYKDRSIKNWPHRQRLKEIQSVIDKESLKEIEDLKYADIGCGTGYLTKIVADLISPTEVSGFDHYPEHLEIARSNYPSYRFELLDLNKPSDIGRFDFVTCFETLEHVGDAHAAIYNLLNATKSGGTLLITLPIEIGPVGIFKFLAKTLIYKYKLDELPQRDGRLYNKYLSSLMTYRDMSRFRDQRSGWGTHFGFDYRRIDEDLKSRGVSFKTRNVVTTRYYIIKPLQSRNFDGGSG
ncbi:MAG: class I SAM-dependent methyltransferase [Candidatus Krumholzibacteriota bacterium]|nr:class I SAM-dependent methyltransferase [Candidatus Krumholzibacteriota bacterium]